ncbi:hypothetical protein PhCBS80983_g03484 [Powellomyces hirtus]|uniref:Kinesin motor domain-containing protein n=1 Tax=Powellomyces hirtus TaxID=109895 RepID=A0A507E251_9FUNG|nr:hypothetical protein PhCBS80983_g03484 [Powellomyces hirtus]
MSRVNSTRPPSVMGQRDAQETNITVVVRVRPRNQKEIRENSPITVTTNGARGKELHVKSTIAESTTKTYSFDKVFGPEANQDLIFVDVLAPMLKEVLMGYNCTIFAYGQTGTGKTYTMEGDLNTAKGQHAGLIPRTLYSLFNCLESGDVGEYSVRVSFTELYNEELKDLLSSEEDFRKLRIYDDYNKKGSIVIQNLEETLVKSAADVIAVLQRGSNKRQIAATKMNEVSSRSHSIFCITVHIKETTPEGEELLKVGKLNLVDLAGSENIGRSGAENRRAKEAGMINQSLLTLGRVINALVDRSPHVPYRESKLTRILQDSLGGSTKTCIIAAVSPAKCNIEETLSTLDYAHRAKNIRNKPEINQKMTKRALLRDYEDQISRLKSDLEAAQTKNGIFLSPESYAAMSAETTGKTEEVDALSKAIKAVEEKFKHLTEQHEQKLELLTRTELERDSVNAELNARRQELEETLRNLKDIQQSLMEQQILTGAHAETEKRLDKLAAGLVVTLKSSISDVEGLHQKIDRKSALEKENLKIFHDFQGGLLDQMSQLDGKVSEFANVSSMFCKDLEHNVSDFSDKQCKNLSAHMEGMREQVDDMISHGQTMVSGLGSLDSALSEQVQEVVRLATSLRTTMVDRERQSQAVHDELFSTHRELVMQHQKQLGEWNSLIRNKITGVANSVKSYLERVRLQEMATFQAAEETMKREIESLRRQNQALQTQLAAEREKGASAAHGLLNDITRLVGNYRAQCDESLTAIGASSQQTTESHLKSLGSILDNSTAAAAEASSARDAFIGDLTDSIDVLNHDVGAASETVDMAVRGIVEQCSTVENAVKETIRATANSVVGSASQIESKQEEVLRSAAERIRIQSESVTQLQHKTQTMWGQMQGHLSEVRDENLAVTAAWNDKSQKYHKASKVNHSQMAAHISRTRDEIECNKLTADIPTGQTPQKKSFRYATSWHITRKHDDILREYRENGRMVSPTTMARSFEDALAEDDEVENADPDYFNHDNKVPPAAEKDAPGEIADDVASPDGSEKAVAAAAGDRSSMLPTPAAAVGTPIAGSKLPRTKSIRHGSRKASESSSPMPFRGMENVCLTRGE